MDVRAERDDTRKCIHVETKGAMKTRIELGQCLKRFENVSRVFVLRNDTAKVRSVETGECG